MGRVLDGQADAVERVDQSPEPNLNSHGLPAVPVSAANGCAVNMSVKRGRLLGYSASVSTLASTRTGAVMVKGASGAEHERQDRRDNNAPYRTSQRSRPHQKKQQRSRTPADGRLPHRRSRRYRSFCRDVVHDGQRPRQTLARATA